MSATPPSGPWNDPDYPPPAYPPPGYPPPPPPGGGYPGGAYPGGGYPGGGYEPRPGPMSQYGPLAGWWRRVGAAIIDGLIIGIPIGIVLAVAGLSGFGFSAIDDIFIVVYQIILLSRPRGQTVGNIAVSTRVIDAANGTAIGTTKAFSRAVVELVLNITVIGGILDVLWPLWDQQNQTLHDKAAGTLVVRTGY